MKHEYHNSARDNPGSAAFRLGRNCALGLAFACVTAPLQAATIEAVAEATDLNTATTVNFSDGPANSGFVDVLDFGNVGLGTVSYGIHTFGNVSGAYGSRTNGSGSAGDAWDVNGRFTFSEMFVNPTTVAQNLFVNVSIIPGEVTVGTFDAGGGVLEALFDLEMSADGGSVFSSQYRINNTNGVLTQFQSGTDIAAATASATDGLNLAGNSYQFDALDLTLDLGVVAGGDSVLFAIDLFTQSTGNLDDFADCGDFDGRDGNEPAAHGDGEFGGCNSIARFGDPIFPVTNPGGSGTVTGSFQPVPAPAVFGFMALGLAGLAFGRRRTAR